MNSQAQIDLIEGIREEKLSLVKKGLKNGAKPRTLLTDVANAGLLEVAHLLIEAGAKVNAINAHGNTPLVEAAGGAHLEVVRLLIKHGADVNACDYYATPPLSRAAEGGHLDVVCLLIESGADVNIGNNNINTPLMLAVKEGHPQVIRFLIDAGANVANINELLMRASEDNHRQVVQLLIDLGGDVNARDNYGGNTPLIKAAGAGYLGLVQLLVEFGADVNIKNNYGDTPILKAYSTRKVKVMDFLKQNGATDILGTINIFDTKELKLAKESPFSVSDIKYKDLSYLVKNKIKEITISDANQISRFRLSLYEGNEGQFIIYKKRRYPCFDSHDNMHEDRYYHWYFACSNMKEVEAKLKFIKDNDLWFNSSNMMKYSELCPIVYVDDGKEEFELWTNAT